MRVNNFCLAIEVAVSKTLLGFPGPDLAAGLAAAPRLGGKEFVSFRRLKPGVDFVVAARLSAMSQKRRQVCVGHECSFWFWRAQ
jgi:hypothetical protein